MRIVVFGASGRTGREVVQQCLARQHAVTAFVRRADKLALRHPQLQVVESDVSDAPAVSRTIANHDAVVSTLGVGVPFKPDPAVVDGIRHILAGMSVAGVRRLIYQSFIGVRESRAGVGFVLRFVAPLPLRHEIADHESKEALVRASDLDWTIVRPPKLTDAPATGAYRVGEDISTWAPVPTLARADVAGFIVRELEQPQFVRKAPRLLH
jgi:putative NADH-flavin reductase